MQERFKKLMGGRSLPVTFGTFHAVFFKILKLAYHYQAENIIREDQKHACIREIVRGIDLEIEDEADFISSIISEISLVKGEMLSLDHYYAKNCPETVFKQIYEEYDGFLRRSRRIDFDDMLVMCYELFVPVSYTHLDVYKRQADIAGSSWWCMCSGRSMRRTCMP